MLIVASSDARVRDGWIKLSSADTIDLPSGQTLGSAVYIYAEHPAIDLALRSLGLWVVAAMSMAVLLFFYQDSRYLES
ncbi:hypothetical protein BH11VER1_BH11VER1_15230 [soil metagenome]